MEKKDAHVVCELVAGIVLTDGELHASENALLTRLLEKFDISEKPETVLNLTKTATEAAKAVKALPADVQREALDLLIDAAIVDGKVVPDEQKYLEAVADVLDVTADALDQLVVDKLLAS